MFFKNEQLKKIALCVVKKNLDASLKDVVAELEAHMNVFADLQTLENPTKHAEVIVLKVAQPTQKLKPVVKNPNPITINPTSLTSNKKCNGCGGAHPRSKCTFRNAICHKCSQKGHIAKVCRSSADSPKSVPDSPNPAAEIKNIVTQLLSAIGKRRRHYVTCSIYGKQIILQYDTNNGSDITVVGKNKWIRIGSPKLTASDTIEHAGGSKLDVIGKLLCEIRVLGREGQIYVNVVLQNGVDLFGLDAIDRLNLWSVRLTRLYTCHPTLSVQHVSTRKPPRVTPRTIPPQQLLTNCINSEAVSPHNDCFQDVLQRFPTLFTDKLGICRNFKITFTLTNDAILVQIPCRQIPYAMQTLLDEELRRLESSDIIERVKASIWASPIVIVRKPNGKIRLCVDYSTGVNKASLDNRHPLPTVDYINSKLNGGRLFSLLDLSEAFFQFEIDKVYRELTTMVTPKGLFQQAMDIIFVRP